MNSPAGERPSLGSVSIVPAGPDLVQLLAAKQPLDMSDQFTSVDIFLEPVGLEPILAVGGPPRFGSPCGQVLDPYLAVFEFIGACDNYKRDT